MREETGAMQIFTPEMLETMAYIWARSSISLIDVRHQSIYPEQPLRQYKMPSSTLVYAYGGTAHVQLNETAFAMERFGLFHGGKGTLLSITPEEAALRSYMVLFKAETPPFFKKDLQRLLEQVNPFVLQFGYAPSNPVWLVYLFEQMIDNWSRTTAMNHFHTKNLFYQSMHEIYKDLEQEQTSFLQPDPVISAKRYLDEYYMQPILFQDIADMFAISGGQLTRLFKKREGKSPQEYLTMKRLGAARYQLINTNATMREIAYGCGFIDENTLFRMFKKYYNISPGDYRKKLGVMMQGYTIDNHSQRLYNKKGLDHLVKSRRDGELSMFGQARSKEMIVAAAMSLMLLLSACSTAVSTNTGSSSPTSTSTQAQMTVDVETNGAEQGAQTRVVQTPQGEVEVPVNPKRVVVASIAGDLLELGITPVGAQVNGSLNDTAYSDMAKGIKVIESFKPEEIMTFDPDLIIADNEKEIDNLSKIAPAVFLTWDESVLPKEDRIELLGEIFNKQKEAEQAIEKYHNKIAEAKTRLEEAGLYDSTVTVLGGTIKNPWVGGNVYGIGKLVYDTLGLTPPPAIEKDVFTLGEQWGFPSIEVLPDYCGDYIVYIGDGGDTIHGIDDFGSNEIWEAVPAVVKGNISYLPYTLAWYWDVYSTMAQIDKIVDGLIESARS